MLHLSIVVNNFRISGPDPRLDLRPFGARSIVLSVLLGSHPPEMPVAPLLEFTALFGISDGAVRTALSRMSARGELDSNDGVYRLSGRLLDRQSQQDTGRANPPETWDGQWWTAVVLSDRRTLAERRIFRSRAQGARLGELRPDTWLRPANIAVPNDLPDVALTRGRLITGDDEELVRKLWDLDALDRQARELLDRVDQTHRLLDRDEPSDAAFASAFTVLATCLRYLRIEPQLPGELAHGTASNDLRARYGDVEQMFQDQLAGFFQRRGVSRAAL
jgi:phenylacetic acid degradation operon negative regulatory protein